MIGYNLFGDKVKKRILGIIIPVMGAIICGYICGKYVYSFYRDNVYEELISSKIYLVESGKYDSYDNMREDNNGNNYVYYHDEEGYKTVVGITRNYDNVSKIRELYSSNLEVYEYYVPVGFINSRQDELDKSLSETSDVYEVKEVVDNILNLYRESDSIKLISIG